METHSLVNIVLLVIGSLSALTSFLRFVIRLEWTEPFARWVITLNLAAAITLGTAALRQMELAGWAEPVVLTLRTVSLCLLVVMFAYQHKLIAEADRTRDLIDFVPKHTNERHIQ